MRNFLIGIGVLAVLFFGAAIAVPKLVDWNSYKTGIQQQVKQATGRNLTIAGDLDLAILPAPRLLVKTIRFANAKNGSQPHMVSLEALDVQVRVLPLLQGRVEVASIQLIKPMILLERLADGRANWEFTPPKTSRPDRTQKTNSKDQLATNSTAIRLDNVQIQNGVVMWRDAKSGSEERLENVSLQLRAGSLNGPFDLRGDVSIRNLNAKIEAAIGELKPTTAAPVLLSIVLPKAAVQAQISGSVVAIGALPRFTGKLNLSGKDLHRTLGSLTDGLTVPRSLKQSFLLRANLKGTEKGGSISSIDVEVGGTRASGKVDIELKERPNVSAKVAITRVDLDSLFKSDVIQKPSAAKGGRAEGKPKSTSGAKKPSELKSPALSKPAFQLPDLDGSFDITVDAITYNKRNIRGVDLSLRVAKNVAQLTKARVLLPGGGVSNVTGALSAFEGRPNYQATVSAQADNLRALLTWLGNDISAIPPARLRKFSLSASIRGDDQQMQVLQVKAGVDTTNIDGAVTLALRKRLAFGASVSIDNLDLDAYQTRKEVRQSGSEKSTPAAKRPVSKLNSKQPKQKKSGTKPSLPAPLAALTGFDANVNMQVSRLTVKKTPMRDVRFEGTLAGGVLKIKRASVRDVGGMRASVSGELKNLAGLPAFNGSISADAADITGPLRLAGITPPPNAKNLGALRLRGKAEASSNRVKLNLSLAAAGASTSVIGTVSSFDSLPKVNATVIAKHRNLSQLLRVFGAEPVAQSLGAFGLNLTAKGDLASLTAKLDLAVAGGKLAASGTVRNLIRSPAFAMNVKASHPSVRRFVRYFVPDYRPAGGALGRLSIEAGLSGQGQNFSLRKFSVGAGRLILKGTGNLDTRRARPKITAVFDAEDINVNPFLPPDRSANRSPARSRVERRRNQVERRSARSQRRSSPVTEVRYSSKRIDTSPLGLIDADISIAAKSLRYRQFLVKNPAINGALSDKVLSIKKIAGKMFDGDFLLNGKFDGRKIPKLDGRVVVSKANVGTALFQTGTFDIKGGITDFDLNISSTGISPLAMIRSLNGSGKLASRNGIVSGFDLRAMSDRLKNIDGVIDLLTLLVGSMQGGQSRFSKLDASFKINKGIVRSNDVFLKADAAEGRATGFANLPKWHMDFGSQFRLIEHPKAPAFKMRAVGPFDNPRRFFDFKELQSFLLRRGVGSLIRKVFPGSRRSNQPPNSSTDDPSNPAQQQAPSRKPRLEDLIPGVLDLLNKR